MIRRDVPATLARRYDVVIVGAGAHGTALALECVARRLTPLVIDQHDFGAMTSWSTLRIIHGGLRYLQSLDLRRFRSSVEQRRWWLRLFPELVRPATCLMPLYGQGMHRPSVLRAALLANDLLSWQRNRGVTEAQKVPRGRIVGPEESVRMFPGVRTDGLRGSAVWTDGSMVSPQRILIEMLRWVTAAGGSALNYVAAEGLVTRGGRVQAVRVRDEVTGTPYEVAAPMVLNASGPWCSEVVAAFGAGEPKALQPSLAFNLLLRKPLPANVSVAVSSPERGPVRFLRPMKDLTFAGTVHAPWPSDIPRTSNPTPSEAAISMFTDELTRSLPGWHVDLDDVVRVFAGLIPAEHASSAEPRRHPILIDHGRHGGPDGLHSVAGVKFTTAPAVARTLLNRVTGTPPDWARLSALRPPLRDWPSAQRLSDHGSIDEAVARLRPELAEISREESVVYGEDLVLRRLDWSLDDIHLDDTLSIISELPELALTAR